MRYGYQLSKAFGIGIILFMVWSMPLPLHAQEYQVGTDDVLDVSFWQDPSLNTQVRVGQDGKVTLGVIGEISAAGKTTNELQDEIVRLMSRLNKNISQAVVRVFMYNYNYVFVNGQVRTPGKRAFEKIPDIWTVINESGGVTETGDLSRVTLIRGNGKVETINVRRALADSRVDRLPKLNRGDVIEIPASPGNVASSSIGPQIELKNLVYVYGAVNSPGAVTFQENTDFSDILALAGGPSPNANLKKITILTKDKNYTQSYQFNLENYAKTGRPARYIVQKEDTYIVPERQQGFFGTGMNIGTVAAIVGVITSSYLLYDRLTQESTTSPAQSR